LKDVFIKGGAAFVGFGRATQFHHFIERKAGKSTEKERIFVKSTKGKVGEGFQGGPCEQKRVPLLTRARP